LERTEICGGRAKQRIRRERILKPGKDSDGYLKVILCLHGKPNGKTVHRLVLETFFPETQPSINHKDGNKANNNINNLEWCSVSYNVIHAYDNGLHPIGEQHYKAKLKNEDVTIIKNLLFDGSRHSTIARKFNVSISTIQDILKGRSWKRHVAQSYEV
jgi:hypothetical protein